jgi:hypothetical protein
MPRDSSSSGDVVARPMKAWAVALLVFCLGTGVTALCVALWVAPAWRILAAAAGILIASKLAAVSAAAWRERRN